MRIVLLDSDRAHARSLQILLTEQGHVVTAFGDPLSVCESIVPAEGGPDILIADGLVLRGAGDRVLKRLRDLLPRGCQVILLADAWLGAEVDPVGLVAHAVFPKPLDFDLLFRVLGSGQGGEGSTAA